eukprot:TRINITY_DN7939_c0_g1_i1.p1 TRINITY_DN7939_c0_g1~~TRINITY_DN7939_c0_g1_i1.p1  ORF type:complete len:127 (-),score=15.04 TRINITY_DN7939_c0_g1_i1:97-477(-)
MAAARPIASSRRDSGPRASFRSSGRTGCRTRARVGDPRPSLFTNSVVVGLLGRRIEQLDRMRRHHGRNGVLVDELRMGIAAQQHGEIVEPGDDALQLDTIDQEYCHRCLALADMIQEHVLYVLGFF